MSEIGVNFDCVGVAVTVTAGVAVTTPVADGVRATLVCVAVLTSVGIKVGSAVATLVVLTVVAGVVAMLVGNTVATGDAALVAIAVAGGTVATTRAVASAVGRGAAVGAMGGLAVANGGAVGSDVSGTGVRLGVITGRNAPFVTITGGASGVGTAKYAAKASGWAWSGHTVSALSLNKWAFSKNSSAKRCVCEPTGLAQDNIITETKKTLLKRRIIIRNAKPPLVAIYWHARLGTTQILPPQ